VAVTFRPETAPPPDVESDAPVAPPPTYPPVAPEPIGLEAPPRPRGLVAGLILITLGVAALFGMWFPSGGAWLFCGLGVAFALARVLTGRPGYAVPAGILLGFGSFVWATESGVIDPATAGGLFFVCLGLGFLLSYAIAARPQAIWPVVPGVVLIGFGAFLQATTVGAGYAPVLVAGPTLANQPGPGRRVAAGAPAGARRRAPAD